MLNRLFFKIYVGYKRMSLRSKYGASLVLPKSVVFREHFSVKMENIESAHVAVGENVFFNRGCSINCIESVSIGSNCLFGEGVKIYDHDHAFDSGQVYVARFKTAPVVIEDGCWIGTNVVILKGVTIGANTIVGAGTVVTKSIPPNSLVVNELKISTRER